MSEIVSFQAVILGRVQGVGFRYFARQRAEAHGIAGFVRNLPDGSVEVHAEGPAAALAEMVRRVGMIIQHRAVHLRAPWRT